MMEEQTTWKGHTFTLLVFTGIVVLCSIFFILGMLVGRQQGQKFASAASSEKKEAKATQKDDKPDFTFYDSVKKEDRPALQPPPAPKADDAQEAPPSPVEPAKKPDPAPEREFATEPSSGSAPAPAPANAVNLQIGAVRKEADAQKLLDDLKKKGFHAFILTPQDGDPQPYYRVQVGPFTDPVEAKEVENKLKSEKYQVLPKK